MQRDKELKMIKESKKLLMLSGLLALFLQAILYAQVGNGIVDIAAGRNHTVALTEYGTVIEWGNNSENQCDAPAGLANVVAVAAGLYHTVALKEDGTVRWERMKRVNAMYRMNSLITLNISAGRLRRSLKKIRQSSSGETIAKSMPCRQDLLT